MLRPDVWRLASDHLAPSGLPLGQQQGRLVPCSRKPALHGHVPEEEGCPYCPPPPPGLGELYHTHISEVARTSEYLEYLLPPPWSMLTRAERERWDKDAEQAVKDHRGYGLLPAWHPDYEEPAAEEVVIW